MQDVLWTVVAALATNDFTEYVEWMLVVMVTLFVSGLILMRIRRRALRRDRAAREAAGFSIEALEAMRERGEIGPEEFKVLRRAALGLDAGREDDDNAASSGDGGMSMNDEV